MNKFKVWCKNKNEWEKDECALIRDGKLIELKSGKEMLLKNHSIHNDVGITDIYGVNIYLESSIFEFYKCSLDGHKEKIEAFLRESSPMIFQIVVLNNNIWNILYWHEFRHSIENIRIIDTIQENKLGLINEQ
jgi:hypothetical protein